MSSNNVLGKIQVSLGDVKIVAADGNTRDAVFDGLLYEGEQILSTDPEAMFQIKYSALPEATVYTGEFNVHPDSSVVAIADGSENVVDLPDTAAGEENIDDIETEAGEEGPLGNSRNIEDNPTANIYEQSHARGYDGVVGLRARALGDVLEPDGPLNDQPEVADIVLGVGGGEDTIYETYDGRDYRGEDDTDGEHQSDQLQEPLNRIEGTMYVLDDNALDRHIFDVIDTDEGNFTSLQDTGAEGYNMYVDTLVEDDDGLADGVVDAPVSVVIESTDIDASNIDITKIELLNNDGADRAVDFVIEGDFSALAAGETATVTFTYNALDDNAFNFEPNLSDPATVTITVTGTNDQPIVPNMFLGEERIEEFTFDSMEVYKGQEPNPVYERSDTTPLYESHDDEYYQNNKDDTQDDVYTTFTFADENALSVTDKDVNDTHTFHLVQGSVRVDNMESQRVLLGHVEAKTFSLDDWGVAIDNHTREMTLDNGMVITTSSDSAKLRQYDHQQDHVGEGIGDKDGYGIDGDETITVTFGGGFATSATFGFDGLGGHFDPNGVDAKATWTAYNNGVVVASGTVQRDGDNFVEVSSPIPFDEVVFGTDSDAGSNWELRYVEAEVIPVDVVIDANGEFNVMGNFNYLAAGETAEVTFRYYAQDDSADNVDHWIPGESDTSELKEVTLYVTGTNDQPIISHVDANDGEAFYETLTVHEEHEHEYDEFGNKLHGDDDEEDHDPRADVMTTFIAALDTAEDDDVSDTHRYEVVKGTTTGLENAGDDAFVSIYGVDAAGNETDIPADIVGYEYKIEGDFNYLATDETATVKFNYVAIDSSIHQDNGESNTSEPKTITLTITGTNDRPEVENGMFTATETSDPDYNRDTDDDVTTTLTGQLIANDQDLSDEHTFRIKNLGNEDNKYVDSYLEGLNSDDGLVSIENVSIPYPDAGGHKGSGSGEPTVKVFVISQDIDVKELDINSIGITNYAYDHTGPESMTTADFNMIGNFNALGAGETATVIFKYQANDNETADEHTKSKGGYVEVTVTGTNDQPVVEAKTYDITDEVYGDTYYETASAPEGGHPDGLNVLTGMIAVQDLDITDEHHFYVVDTKGGYRENIRSIDGDFDWKDYVRIQSSDIHPSKIDLNSIKLLNTSNNPFSSDYFDSADQIEFELRGDFNALGANETATVTFRYIAVDDSDMTLPRESRFSEPQTVTLTVMGTNDQPKVTNIEFGSTDEALDGVTTILGYFTDEFTGKDVVRDDDINDKHTFEVVSAGKGMDIFTDPRGESEEGDWSRVQVKTITKTDEGTQEGKAWIAVKLPDGVTLEDISFDFIEVDGVNFKLQGDFNALAVEEQLKIKVRYVAVDDSEVGAAGDANNESDTSEAHWITMTVEGTNDAPYYIYDNTAVDFVSESAGYANVLGIYTLDEHGNPTDPQIIMTDTNGGGDPAYTNLDLEFGSFGMFIIPNGDYDGIENQPLSFNLTDPDNPVLIVGTTPVTAYFDNNEWNEGDKDHFDMITNPDGSIEVRIEDLNLGDNDRNDLVVRLTPNVADNKGTVIEIEDGAPGENVATVSTSGVLEFDDPDLSDDPHALSVSYTPDDDGYLGSFNASVTDSAKGVGDGEITWTFDVHDSYLDSLNVDDVIVQTYTVTVTDPYGLSDTQDVTITIRGTNDAPVATGEVVTKVADIEYSEPEDIAYNTSNYVSLGLTVTAYAVGDYSGKTYDGIVNTTGNAWGVTSKYDGEKLIDGSVVNDTIVFTFLNSFNSATVNLKEFEGGDEAQWRVYSGNDTDGYIFVNGGTFNTATPGNTENFVVSGLNISRIEITSEKWNSEFKVSSIIVDGGEAETEYLLKSFVIDDATLLANDTDVDGVESEVQLVDASGNIVTTGDLLNGTEVIGQVTINGEGDIQVTPKADYEVDDDSTATFNYIVVDEHGAHSEMATATIDVALESLAGDYSYDPSSPLYGLDNALIVDDGTTLNLSGVSDINVVQLDGASTVYGNGDLNNAGTLNGITASDVISSADGGTLIINSLGDGVDNGICIDVDHTSLGTLTPTIGNATVDINGTTYASYTGIDGTDTATLLIEIDIPIETI